MSVEQISAPELSAMLERKEPVYLLDVRQPWEHELARLNDQLLIPLQELPERLDEVVPAGALVVCYCHHGVRSLSAAALLSAQGIRAASLRGGIEAWSLQIDPAIARY